MSINIETTRLFIREFKIEDLPDVFEYANSEEVVKHMVWGPNSLEQTRAFLNDVLVQQQSPKRTSFEMAIELKSSKKLIGSCGLTIEKGNALKANLGYIMNEKYWNQGFISEAIENAIPLIAYRIGVDTIFATCNARNAASKRVLEKFGMVFLREFKNHFESKGKMRDTLYFEKQMKRWN